MKHRHDMAIVNVAVLLRPTCLSALLYAVLVGGFGCELTFGEFDEVAGEGGPPKGLIQLMAGNRARRGVAFATPRTTA